MRVYEVIKNADNRKVTNYLKEYHACDYENDDEILASFLLFKNEMKKYRLPVALKPSEEDLVVFVMKTYSPNCIIEKDKESNPDDNIYFDVCGMHTKDFLKYQSEIGLNIKQIREIRGLPDNEPIYDDVLHKYGLDLLDRETALSLNVASVVFDYYDFDLIAAEMFWEFTFYGLLNDRADERRSELIDSLEESLSLIKKSKNEDGTINQEEFDKHFKSVSVDDLFDDVPEETDEEKAYHEFAIDRNMAETIRMQKDYFENYREEIELFTSIRNARKALKKANKKLKKDLKKKNEDIDR